MPFFEPQEPMTRAPTGEAPPNPLLPSGMDVLRSAGILDNTMVSLGRQLLEEQYPPEDTGSRAPGSQEPYNPLNEIKGTRFEERYADRFIPSLSSRETQSIMRRITEEEDARKTLETAGWPGTVASIAAGLIDPSLALPAGTIYKSTRGGYSLLRSGLSVGAAAGAQSALQESILHATQETRTMGQTTAAIASSAILGGLIGFGASGLLSRGERVALERALDRERIAINRHASGKPEMPARAADDIVDLVDDETPAGLHRGDAQPQPGVEAMTFEQFRAAARQGVIGPSEQPGFARIPRETSILRGDVDQLIFHRDVGMNLGYRDEDIAAFLAHRWAMGHDPAYRAARETAARNGTADPPITDAYIRAAHNEVREQAAKSKPVLAGERVQADTSFDGVTTYRTMVDGEEVASARIRNDGDGEAHISSIEVAPTVQRKGVASRLYDRITQELSAQGVKLVPDTALTDAAHAFWKARNPAAVEGYTKPAGAAMWRAPEEAVTRAGNLAKRADELERRAQNLSSRAFEADKAGNLELRDRLLAERDPLISEAADVRISLQEPTFGAHAAGAAGTDTRRLEPVPYGFDKIPGWSRFARFLGTDLGIYSSRSVAARRTASEMFETSLRFKQNLQGEVTSPIVPLDREVKTHMETTQIKTQDEMRRLYSEYFFGSGDVRLPYVRAEFETRTGRAPDKLSPAEFDREVATAMNLGDTHAVPQVQQAAQYIRQNVLEPWAARMEAANPNFKRQEFSPGKSYFPWHYEHEKIASERPGFVEKAVLPHLVADQASKRAAQDRLRLHAGALGVQHDQIDKLTARIAKLSDDAEVVQARQEEATRVNKFAFQRSTELRESEFRNDGGVRVAVPGKNIEKARGGAVFETKVRNRGNELADRVSGKLAEIETLERRLATEIANHDAARTKIEAEISAWEGKSVGEAKSAMKARQVAEDARVARATAKGEPPPTERLQSADPAIDRAVKHILESDRDLSMAELRDKAEEITDHVLGTPIGRLPYDIHITANQGPRSPDRTARGPLFARDFAIPYELARDWVSHELDRAIGAWMRTMVPDTLLWERFPTEGPALTSRYRSIQEEYAALTREAKSAKERSALNKEKDAVIETLDGVLQRIRGTTNNTVGMSGRVGEAVRRVNQMTDLGFAAITSIPDFAGPIMYHGLSKVMGDGWAPYVSYLAGGDLAKMSNRELRAMSVAAEMENASRGHALSEINDVYNPTTKVERALKATSDKFFMVNLQAQQTNEAKRVAGRTAMAEMHRAMEAEVAGRATKRQIEMLRESNIDAAMSSRIIEQFNSPGGSSTIDGVKLSNSDSWTDAQARLHYIAAVARDVERAVVTPGAEKPLWLSSNAGSLLGQYKSFAIASTTKILISNIQRHDAQALQGVISAVAAGVLSYYIATAIRGGTPHQRPQDIIKEGINRSGLNGAFEDVNMFLSKATRGTFDVYQLIGAGKPLSRNANRTFLSSLLGPTAGKIEGMTRVTGAAGAGEWTEADTHALRRLIAGQNLFWLNKTFDEVEKGINGRFGIEMKPKP